MADIDIDAIIAEIQRLQRTREELLTGDLAPAGAWIHTHTIKRTYPGGITYTYEYAKWQAHEAIFSRNPKKKGKYAGITGYTKHQHIGRVGSSSGLGMDEETEDAYRLMRNRERLEAIEKTLLEIQSLLGR